MREIVFDTETTGLNPETGDRLVEIGCIELVNRVETGRTFHAYFNPERDMPAEAERVHGLRAEFLVKHPCFRERVGEVVEFLGDAPLVAHNASFDFGFLNWELQACGFDPVCLSRMVDTWAIARARHPGAKHSLDALCARYGVDRSARVKHGALLDAQLLAQVYVELTGGRQIGLSLMTEAAAPAVAAASEAAAVLPRNDYRRVPRAHRPSAAELARHAAFVSTLVDPLWEAVSARP